MHASQAVNKRMEHMRDFVTTEAGLLHRAVCMVQGQGSHSAAPFVFSLLTKACALCVQVQALLALCPKPLGASPVGCQPPPERQPERKARFPPAALQTGAPKPPFLRDSSASSTAELIQVGGGTPTREEGVLIDRISAALVK